jgi:N4-gp56 family major capsid protein
MAIEMLGAAGMANEMKQFYDKKLLDRAVIDTVYENYGVKRPIPARGGKSIEWRRFEWIDCTEGSYTLTEGTPPSATNATISNVAATISQYGAFSQISDILDTQGYDPVLAEYTDAYGQWMGKARDIVVRAELSNATTIQYAAGGTRVGTSGAGAVGSGGYLNAAEITEAVRTLRRNGAKAPFKCFIHPDNTKDLREDPDIVDAWQNAADRGAVNPLFSGIIGKWSGVEFIETNNLKVRSSYGMSGADIYEVVVFGEGFYGVTDLSAQAAKTVIHPKGTGGHTDPLDQYSTVGAKFAMAAKILNNDFGVLINCASSRTPAA